MDTVININLNKIIKVEVFSSSDEMLVSSDDFTVSVGDKGHEMVIIKSNKIKEIPMGTNVGVVFNCTNGDRVKYEATVEVCTNYQINVLVGDSSYVLEERRKYYKVYTNLPTKILLLTREERDIVFSNPVPATISNINIGGVFLRTDYTLKEGDIIVISLEVCNKKMDLSARVLRVQIKDNIIEGYGCQFLKLRTSEEETLARYINEAQRESLDMIKTKLNKR
jgi:c-di-GMP-binding flagellar brake protein YcgR